MISSLQTDSSLFKTLMFTTSSSFLSCFSICESISSSPDDTTVILVYLGSAVIPAVMLSMLYPRRLNSPAIRLKTPGLLSTSSENT